MLHRFQWEQHKDQTTEGNGKIMKLIQLIEQRVLEEDGAARSVIAEDPLAPVLGVHLPQDGGACPAPRPWGCLLIATPLQLPLFSRAWSRVSCCSSTF